MIARPEYMKSLINFKDKDLIKVITGIRRCGKSTLFDLFIEYLKNNDVEDEQILKLNLEDPEYSFLDDYKKLYDYVKERLNPDKKNYIFLDEVQIVREFQKACDGLYIKKNIDLYITGSNADLLSGELATLLSGRYVEIQMFPLSFKEYMSTFDSTDNLEKRYVNYITHSSFPYALQLKSKTEVRQYLDSLYNTIFIKDIATRNKFSDISMLQSVSKFLFDNIGNLTNANRIANTMTSYGRKISVKTVESYLIALIDSFMFKKADRYDVKGKTHLKTGEKYYATDIGMRYNVLGKSSGDDGHILENIVYLELKRRGYKVYIGKVGNTEVDFVAESPEETLYFQVAYTVREEKNLERELAPLEAIKDHNPKYLLVMDIDPEASYNGIRKLNVLDWLLDK